MGRVIKGLAKVARPIASAIGKVTNFIPNMLGKIPVVGGVLKKVSSLGMMLIPGLGALGLASKLGTIGKLGGLGSKVAGLLGKVPGAGKMASAAGKLKDWGSTAFSAGKGQLAKLPKMGKDALKFTKNELASIPQHLHLTHQTKQAGAEAALVAQYQAQERQMLASYAMGNAAQMFA